MLFLLASSPTVTATAPSSLCEQHICCDPLGEQPWGNNVSSVTVTRHEPTEIVRELGKVTCDERLGRVGGDLLCTVVDLKL